MKRIASKNVKLRELTTPVSFGIKMVMGGGKVTIKYIEDYNDEVFTNFNEYLESLSYYYRNRIDCEIEQSSKLATCNSFLDVLQNYKLDLRKRIYDDDVFFKEIDIYKEQFNYYKHRITESNSFQTKVSTRQEAQFSLKQQILILDYLKMLEALNEVKLIKQKASIISVLLNKHVDNVDDAIRYIGNITKKGKNVVKTKENLQAVYNYFNQIGLQDVASAVNQDLIKIK